MPLRWLHNGKKCVPSFMKIGAGIRGILRFCLRNLRGCNVGIIDKVEF
jgi:hypothetical protein